MAEDHVWGILPTRGGLGEGRCDKYHGRAETTEASVSRTGPNDLTEGLFNIGVAPRAEDGGDILQLGLGMFSCFDPDDFVTLDLSAKFFLLSPSILQMSFDKKIPIHAT